MLEITLNVIAGLLLAGLGIYTVISARLLRHNQVLRRVVIATVLGAISGISSIVDPAISTNLHIAIESGPLLMAGFIGGPLGVPIAGALAFAMNAIFGPVHMNFAAHFLFPALGAALGWWRFRSVCVTVTPPRTLELAAAGLAGMAVLVWLGVLPASESLPLVLLVAATGISATAAVAAAAMHAARTYRELDSFKEHMQLASDVARIGTWEWYVPENRCDWDQGMHALYGTDSANGTIQPDRFMEMVHPDDRQRLHLSHEAASLNGAPAQDEFRVYRTDGQLRTIRSALVNRYDENGKLIRISGIHMDVTDLRSAEAGRGVAESRLETVTENVPGALVSLTLHPDKSLIVRFLNAYCERLLEVTEHDVSSHPTRLTGMILPDDAEALNRAVTRSIAHREDFLHRWRMSLPSGREIWLEGRGTASREGNGDVHLNAFLVDISDIMRTEAELADQRERAARAERLESVGKLSGGIAHDFNNLLAIIIGNLEILRDSLTGNEKCQGYVHDSLDAAVRGADLVRNMLSFARRAQLEPSQQSVSDLLSRVEGWVARVLPATIDVSIETPDDTWPIMVDASGAENALVNLILNARDAMPSGGTLSISARNETVSRQDGETGPEPGRYVVIEVSDTGHGIAAEHLSHVFEPFFTTRSPDGPSGSGLGLSTVHGFMQQSRGAIRLNSNSGQGTRIFLHFPAAQEPAQETCDTGTTAPRDGRDGVRVLIAEDEPQVALVLERSLERAGHSVSSATTGDKAAQLYKERGPFDLLVTDIVMPGKLQGPALAMELRRSDPDLPVVFLSGYAPDSINVTDAIRTGDPFLMKPVVRDELLDAVRRALSHRTERTAAE